MSFYQFKRQQVLTKSKDELWDFISNPKNLKKITPAYMGFDITSVDVPDKIYKGMIISYKLSPVFGMKTNWVTEITQVTPGSYFVDEQRVGPYKMWHHQHFLEPKDGGTLMTDIISYQVPFGFLGSLANGIIVKRKLEEIFEYRNKALKELFGN